MTLDEIKTRFHNILCCDEICIGPGWWNLAFNCLLAIECLAPCWKVNCIKEKFGALRINPVRPLGEEFDALSVAYVIVGTCELVSQHVCELCGEPGITTNHPGNQWYIQTLCAEHAKAI